MGNGNQRVLWRSGDDVRIDWGYLYLAVRGSAITGNEAYNGLYAIWAETELAPDALFAVAYDDIRSLIYFEKELSAYWNKDGKTITEAIEEALEGFADQVEEKVEAIADKIEDMIDGDEA
jgi:hypothetical protein